MNSAIKKVEGVLHLQEEVSWQPYAALQVHAFATICFFVFISATQAFLLVSQYRVPGSTIGFVQGQLGLADEITSLIFLFIWGLVSDRIGRRAVLAIGYAVAALGLFTMPLGTNWSPDLVLTRVLFAIGSSAMAAVLTAMLGEVVAPKGLPRASSLMGLMSGAGALSAAYGFLRLGSVQCLRSTYFTVAGICIILGVIVVGLYRNVPDAHRPQTTVEALTGVTRIPGLMRKDPNLALSILGSFPARSGSVVASLYLSSWFINYMTISGECPPQGAPSPNATSIFCGLSDTRCPKAVAASSSANGIVQTVALVGAVIFGIVMERLPHPRWGVLIAGFIGALGYGTVPLVTNPRSANIYGAAVGMGLGQISMIISAQVFLVRQMPKEHLGTLSGLYSFCGALAVIMVGVWGGKIFDSGYYQGPFLMVGIIFALTFVVAALVIIFVPVIDEVDDKSDVSIDQSVVPAANLATDLKKVGPEDGADPEAK